MRQGTVHITVYNPETTAPKYCTSAYTARIPSSPRSNFFSLDVDYVLLFLAFSYYTHILITRYEYTLRGSFNAICLSTGSVPDPVLCSVRPALRVLLHISCIVLSFFDQRHGAF
jgi:hypothetical protein